MKGISKILMIVFTGLIFVSFFMPWVSVDSSVKGVITKFLHNKNASIMTVSAYQVPIMANRTDSHLMIDVIKIFNPNIKDADKKSWLIWGIAILAVVLCLVFLFLDHKWFYLGVGILGVLIFSVGTYEIMTTDLDKVVMNVTIQPGVWLTLGGYLGMGLVCLMQFFNKKK